MKSKKIAIAIFITVLIAGIILSIDNKNKTAKMNESTKYTKKNYIGKLNPISKNHAIKIIKAEYGDLITISKTDIKKVGEEYIIDVLLKEEVESDHNHENHASLGIHKINIYTGELIFPN